MNIVFILSFLVTSVSAFVILPTTTNAKSAFVSSLSVMVPADQMTSDQLKIRAMVEKWREVRLYDREQAEAELDAEWLTAYNKFHDDYQQSIARMLEIKEKLGPVIEPPKIQKKGKKQRKRDLFALKTARLASMRKSFGVKSD